ncbi:hypothetical protein BGW80DRAFT_1333599 [Lactifluus volemus]|nr:hypothetical protein BGW80DRAFT_1333599 [Lactifluus volemus]
MNPPDHTQIPIDRLSMVRTITDMPLRSISFPRVTIGSLPEIVLLDIFEFYIKAAGCTHQWHVLVHVCQIWRYLVFASPQRLNLQILCSTTTPVKRLLYVWPRHLPIFVSNFEQHSRGPVVDDIVAALEHRDRVCRIDIDAISDDEFGPLFTVMQEPYPALTDIRLGVWFRRGLVPSLTDTFLGGSVPQLKSLTIYGIPFPALPKFLLGSHALVSLELWSIPYTGYIPPEAMVKSLSTLTHLEHLLIVFESATAFPDQISRYPPLSTRVVLPALTHLTFRGISEYFEDFAVRIDTPLLHIGLLDIRFCFNQDVLDIPHSIDFINRAEKPEITHLKLAEMSFEHNYAAISLYVERGDYRVDGFSIRAECRALDREISYLTQMCNQLSTFLVGVEQLDLRQDIFWLQQDDIDSAQWLDLFRLFPSVRALRIAPVLQPLIAPVLGGLTEEMIMEVFPALHGLHISKVASSGQFLGTDPIVSFTTARQLSDHPVALHDWTCWIRS